MPTVGKYGKHVIQVPSNSKYGKYVIQVLIVGKYRLPEPHKHEAMAREVLATAQECRRESVALSSRHDF